MSNDDGWREDVENAPPLVNIYVQTSDERVYSAYVNNVGDFRTWEGSERPGEKINEKVVLWQPQPKPREMPKAFEVEEGTCVLVWKREYNACMSVGARIDYSERDNEAFIIEQSKKYPNNQYRICRLEPLPGFWQGGKNYE